MVQNNKNICLAMEWETKPDPNNSYTEKISLIFVYSLCKQSAFVTYIDSH